MKVSKSVFKSLKIAIVLMMISFSSAMILTSCYVNYVLSHKKMTHEEMELFLSEIRTLPLDVLVEIYMISYVRYRMWKRGFYLPYGLKVTFVLLIAASMLSLITASVFSDEILDVLPQVPRLYVCIAENVSYIPFFFVWLIFPDRKSNGVSCCEV